jgi:hypothetical protein
LPLTEFWICLNTGGSYIYSIFVLSSDTYFLSSILLIYSFSFSTFVNDWNSLFDRQLTNWSLYIESITETYSLF